MKPLDRLCAEYLSSFATVADMPVASSAEFCILGRSNVGKSSFINHMFGDRTLARVAKKPGRTALANSYRVSDGTFWIDLPGYGFAATSKTEKLRWSGLISDICEKRPSVQGAFWLLDSRHPGQTADCEAFEWIESIDLPILPVFTKVDKLSRNELARSVAEYGKLFRFSNQPVLYSINDEKSRDRFRQVYLSWKLTLGNR